jgi:hypothetical protein
MKTLFRNKLTLLAIAACLGLGNSVAVAQVGERKDLQESTDFKGIHWKRGIGGRPNTARITDGKTFTNVTEQEYRERGYAPIFEKLPELIVQRVPVQQKYE